MAKQRVKVERQEMSKFHNFEKEKICAGTVLGVKEITTKFGPGNVIEMANTDGEPVGVMQTAGLKGYDWMSMVGKEVEIEFANYLKTDNGIMMAYEVYILE